MDAMGQTICCNDGGDNEEALTLAIIPEIGRTITLPPRDIMVKLLEIQGIALDPADIEPAIQRVVAAIKAGMAKHVLDECDGKKSYHVFISYRVNADKDLAEKVYYALKADGLHPFWDKRW